MGGMKKPITRNNNGGISVHTSVPPEMADDYEKLIRSGYRPQEIVKEGIRTARLSLVINQ